MRDFALDSLQCLGYNASPSRTLPTIWRHDTQQMFHTFIDKKLFSQTRCIIKLHNVIHLEYKNTRKRRQKKTQPTRKKLRRNHREKSSACRIGWQSTFLPGYYPKYVPLHESVADTWDITPHTAHHHPGHGGWRQKEGGRSDDHCGDCRPWAWEWGGSNRDRLIPTTELRFCVRFIPQRPSLRVVVDVKHLNPHHTINCLPIQWV